VSLTEHAENVVGLDELPNGAYPWRHECSHVVPSNLPYSPRASCELVIRVPTSINEANTVLPSVTLHYVNRLAMGLNPTTTDPLGIVQYVLRMCVGQLHHLSG
jgi:hypothetical protein